MSHPQKIKGIQLASSDTQRTSAALELAKEATNVTNWSFQTTFTLSPTGSLNIQVSNDESSPTNWTTLNYYGNDYEILISGSQSEPSLQFARQLAFVWVRQLWTPASGSTGTIFSNACAVGG